MKNCALRTQYYYIKRVLLKYFLVNALDSVSFFAVVILSRTSDDFHAKCDKGRAKFRSISVPRQPDGGIVILFKETKAVRRRGGRGPGKR